MPSADVLSPVQVGTDTDWQSVAAGSGFTLAIKTSGTLWAWGTNASGQLGLGDTFGHSGIEQVGTSAHWTLVRAGSDQSAALRDDGTLWTWGYNGVGQLGLGDHANRSSPTRVGTDADWIDVAIDGHGIAVKGGATSTVYVWGRNDVDQLGFSSGGADVLTPTAVTVQ